MQQSYNLKPHDDQFFLGHYALTNARHQIALYGRKVLAVVETGNVIGHVKLSFGPVPTITLPDTLHLQSK